MVIATINAFVLVLWVPEGALSNEIVDEFTTKLLLATIITSITWILTTLLTKPEKEEVLQNFVNKIKPGIGWKKFGGERSGTFGLNLLSVLVGVFAVYSALFAIGNLIYGNNPIFLILTTIFGLSVYFIFWVWRKS